MVSRRNFLKDALVQESRAYGFTIAFWGSGALLIKYSGLPTLTQALMYGLGALFGFGLLSIYIYRSAFDEPDTEEESEVLVLSMIHYFGALLPMIAAYYASRIVEPVNFFVTGASVSILYNLGMVAEEVLSEKSRLIEEKLYNL